MKNKAGNNKDVQRLVSLFSGCGGFDLGFKKAGFNIVWANDFDSDAQAVYNLNFGEDSVDPRDILTVGVEDIPDGDIITAGFPCQPFSNAGNRKGVHDSRGMLYTECLRIIEKKMPKVIVFENVRGLLSTKYIDGRNLTEVIVEDLSTMNGIGYNVIYQLVNASDYGVPQNRYRVLFVGIRKDLSKTFIFPDKLPKENLTLSHVLDQPQDAPNQVHWELSPQALDMITSHTGGWFVEGCSLRASCARAFQRIRNQNEENIDPRTFIGASLAPNMRTIQLLPNPKNCGIIHLWKTGVILYVKWLVYRRFLMTPFLLTIHHVT